MHEMPSKKWIITSWMGGGLLLKRQGLLKGDHVIVDPDLMISVSSVAGRDIGKGLSLLMAGILWVNNSDLEYEVNK